MACVADDQLALLLEGAPLGDGALAHLDGCVSCRALVAALAREQWGAAAAVAPLAPGAPVGRYVVERRVGRGAMGAVYAARDPALGRTVALKIVAPEARALGEALDQRLAEEARTLARLAHPHVVAVFDVGRFELGAFVAMEYVDGADLAQFLATAPPLDRRVQVIAEVARGLAAAHAAGIVHRDVKPANVLVGCDGRARIGDFGLSSGTSRAERAGTPAYMAPELRARGPATAASDQWALAMVALEAVYGARPASLAALPARDARGEVVDDRVRAALIRAADPDPARRWPTVAALADALSPPSDEGRRTTALMVAAVGVTAIVGALTLAGPRAAPSPCVPLTAHDWSDVEARYRAIDAPWAPAVAASVLRRASELSGALARDGAAHCAALARASTAELREREARVGPCLLRRDAALGAAAEALRGGDRAALERGVEVVARAAQPCGAAPLPDDRAARRAVLEVLAARLGLDAARAAGRTASVAAALPALVARAAAIGHPATEAEVRSFAADVALELGALDEADRHLDAALMAADAAGLDALRFDACLGRVGVELSRTDTVAAQRAWAQCAAVDARLAPDPRRTVSLELGRAMLAVTADRRAEAQAHYARALERMAPLEPPDSPWRLDTETRYASLLRNDYRLDEAEALLSASLRALEDSRGPAHPLTASTRLERASLAWGRGDLAGAAEGARRALEAYESAYGPRSPVTAEAREAFGLFLLEAGRVDEAAEPLRVALADARAALGEDHPMVALDRVNLGAYLRRKGRVAEALAEHEAARAVLARDPSVGSLGIVWYELGMDELARGRPARAEAAFAEGRRAYEAASSPADPEVAFFEHGQGRARLALGRAAAAVAPLEQALARRRAAGVDPRRIADVELDLARALTASAGDGERASALRASGRARYAALGEAPPAPEAWR